MQTTDKFIFSASSQDEKLAMIYQALGDHLKVDSATEDDIYKCISDHDNRIKAIEYENIRICGQREGKKAWWVEHKDVILILLTLSFSRGADLLTEILREVHTLR
jgi:hypothetical protein